MSAFAIICSRSAKPDISPGLVPHFAAEAASFGISIFDQAVIVLTSANYWRSLSSGIEAQRLLVKANIRTASTPTQIDSLVAGYQADMGVL
ncbi:MULTISPECIES: hypothetical protein [Rhizobium]|uniref:Uncharacterized protein n=1 Tax=Rhizobium wuzhouense TaxID=1986026 RepID=A0ABX5NV73_9HYPH|nr:MULTISPECIES: hypothetical protein [Rhizobium]PYB77065.1 hypothetical protein DMY87_01370 [Rhizobium wuzhouense]